MLRLAILFLVIALILGAFGFYGTASAFGNVAWILFVLFLVLFVVSLVLSAPWGTRGPPV